MARSHSLSSARSRSRSPPAPRRPRSRSRRDSSESGRNSSPRRSSTTRRSPRRSSPTRRSSRSRSPTRRGSSHSSRRSSPSRGHAELAGINYETAYNALRAKTAIQNQKKRSRTDGKARSTQAMGRGIRMLVALFGEIPALVADAEQYSLEPMEDVDYDDFTDGLTEEEQAYLAAKREGERSVAAFTQLLRLVPSLKSKLVGDPDELVSFYRSLQKGANDSRSDDLSRVSQRVAEMINSERDRPDLAVFNFTPPIIDDKGKAVTQYPPLLPHRERDTRGVQNDYCLGLLCPIEHDVADEEVRNSLRSSTTSNSTDKEYRLTESFYARLFYHGFRGDADNVDEGFLKSRLLVLNYKAVFTGPGSAKEDIENAPPAKRPRGEAGAIRKNVAEILGMNGKVTPRSIAYIAILTHISLTTARHWSNEYYGISYPQMYNFFVDYFEVPQDGTPERAHADKLLAWWNSQVFTNHASSAATNPTAISSAARLRAQRQARAAAAAAAAAAAEAAAAPAGSTSGTVDPSGVGPDAEQSSEEPDA